MNRTTRPHPPGCRPAADPSGNRAGSILLIAAGTLICLFIFALGYSRFLSKQSAMADKMIKRQKLGELASAIATLAAHKLQFMSQILPSAAAMPSRPSQSPALMGLFEYLARPLHEFDSLHEFDLPLDEDDTAHFSMMLGSLMTAAGYSEADKPVEKIRVIVCNSDFQATGPARDSYTREKAGNIRISINLKMVNGEHVVSSVDFDYACPVRICTVHAPVLSKFNLYVEDATLSPGDTETDYNQVGVNRMGNHDESGVKPVPLVLNNDDRKNLPMKRELRNFVEDARGLVYLGGTGRIFLNLARSDVNAPNANSGEGFQFFRVPLTGDGFYTPYPEGRTADGKKVFISLMDQGVSDDPDPRSRSFLAPIVAGQPGKALVETGRMELASIFRLFGVQRRPSPTLVLGNVYARFLSLSMLSVEADGTFVPQILQNLTFKAPLEPPPYYADLIAQPAYAPLREGFALDGSYESYSKYIQQYSPRIRHRPYNQALGYIDKPNDPDAPQIFDDADPISIYAKPGNNPTSGVPAFHKAPGVFAAIYPDVADLKDLSDLLSPAVSLSRISYRFENAGDTDAAAFLKKQNLLFNDALAVNGWVTFASDIRIDRPLTYKSGAGLIVEHGDIVISAKITPHLEKENCLLYLIARDGNVIFDCNPGDTVQASVIADSEKPGKGRVLFRRPPKSIRGALAMKKLVSSRDEAAGFKGTELTYFSPLAALPAGNDKRSGDEGLLSYCFDQYPQELK
ncbi:MAG TPA: hypothetical protein PLU72_13010 [Candidatus Ozemobacteraceae bacterium]|nr:hypothetical protein [Candidatus Ozemobacteraceae bacterium]